MDFLTIIAPDGAKTRHEIRSQALRIGRSSGSDLVLQDLNVSRVHAEIVQRPEGCYVRDTGGKNGTFVNERRIDAPTLLRPGDQIRLGTTRLVFNGSAASRVEFSDEPLAQGPGTTWLPADSLRTPRLTSAPPGGAPPAPRRDAPLPAASATSFLSSPGELSADSLAIFFEADKELVFHRPINELLETIMDLTYRAVPFERGLLMLREGGELRPRVVRVPEEDAGRPISISRTIADRVVQHKESVLTSDAQLDARFREGRSVEMQQLRSVMCVPLWNNRDVIGLLYVDSRQRVGLFTQPDLRLLTHLANIAAVKIENARLFEQVVAAEMMEQELQRAAEIQNHLLPGAGPPIPGYEVHGSSLPCRAVGGDYFDYIELARGRYAIGLGDVAGKGIASALLMCAFQASLRAFSELELPPDETMVRLNRLLCRTVPDNRFVTFFYGVLDPARHELAYVNAGQTPPWILRAGGERERLPQSGPPLGLFPESGYTVGSAPLGPGDLVVCYSDGVSEAPGPGGEEFGEERLVTLVEKARGDSPAALVEEISAALAEYCRTDVHQDDVTLVILKRLP